MELGKIPAPSHEEEKRAEYLKNYLFKEGFSDVRIDEAKNVILRMGKKDAERSICFAAHTDVVCPLTDKIPLKVDEAFVYAPGIGDDAANIVNLLMALKCFRRFRWETEKEVLFVFNSCEEGLGNLKGTRYLFETLAPSEFVSFDLYQGMCCSGAVGSHRYEICLRVKGGHSWFDYGRENAIVEASRLIAKLWEMKVPADVKTTMNVGTITGGTTVNSIPQEAKFTFEYRSESDRNLNFMKKQFEEALRTFRNDSGAELSVEVIGIRPAMGEIDKEALASFTEKSRAAIERHYKEDLDLAAFSTDANIPLSKGIPANTIGTAVGGGAHTEKEWIRKTGQLSGMKIAAEVVKTHVS